MTDQTNVGPGPKAPSVPITPMVPFDPSINTWTRFIGTFEPYEFTNWVDESVSWKTDCFIGDWSPLFKIRVRGPEAQKFFEFISTNHWPNFKRGQAKHAIMCQDNGSVMGDGVLMMLGDDDFIFTSGPGVPWAVFQFRYGQKKFDATLEIVTDQWYLLQIQGPKSVQLMNEITGNTTHDIKFMHAKEMSIEGCKFLCLRQGISGELGFELWGPAEESHKIYGAILELGRKKFGIRQLGGRTKAVNHVEGGFATPRLEFLPALHGDSEELVHYRKFLLDSWGGYLLAPGAGGSFDNGPKSHHRTPFDLSWGWLVNFDHDFIGKRALEGVAKDPPNAFVTLVWDAADVVDVYSSHFTDTPYAYMEIPRAPIGKVEGSTVYASTEGKVVGCALSRCYSYWFKQMISLAIIDKRFSTLGTTVVVKWGPEGKPQKMIKAVVHRAPYKEDKRRHRLD
ncbi:glycine cleavage T protein [Ilyonectria destructans]|nr:glycine cleavage T protein [Ilyonectria destructans]